MAKHKSKKTSLDMPQIVMTFIKANMMGYALTAIFILLGSIILTYSRASVAVEKWIVLIGIVLSAFLVGFDTAKVESRNGYKWGAAGGVLYLIIYIVLATVLNGLKSISFSTLITIAVLVIISSSIAGMVSVNYRR